MTDVKITPASRKVEFFGSDDALDAVISTDTSGNLSITNVGGEISLGDTTADIHIGDGTNSVDLVFDQAGSIYSVSGQQLTLGSTTGGSTAVDSTLYLNGWTYVDVAGQNFVLRSDTNQRETFEFQQGTTRRWVLNLEADGDLNFNASNSADKFRVQGSRVLTTADEGSGNGLDADTLDGYHSSSFLRESMGAISSDFNNYTSTGIFVVNNWSGSSISNGPSGSYAWGMLEVKQFSGTSGTYVNQQYWPHNTDGVWTRTKWNGTWTGWREIYASSSDGSGSGLDADLLDGVQGSSYLRSDTSDTMTGDLVITGQNALICDGIDSGNPQAGADDLRVSGYGILGNRSTLYFTNGGGAIQFGIGVNHNASAACTIDTSKNFTAQGNVTAYSDERLKDNISTIDGALDKISSIRGVTYNRNDLKDNPRQTGVIAQEVEKVLPEVVRTDDEGMKTVAYGNMVGLLIEAIKEQQTQIDDLKARLGD